MVSRHRRLLALLGLALSAAQLLAQPAQKTAHLAAHQAAHQARPQLASGVAFGPDGRLWLAGLNEQGQLFV